LIAGRDRSRRLGSLFGAFFGGGREHGGPVQAGRLYEVGEHNKPELFTARGKTFLIPGNDGHVTPVAGGMSITQQIYVTGSVDARTAAQMQQEAAVKQRRATARNT
jgi:SLT domain-containing protein